MKSFSTILLCLICTFAAAQQDSTVNLKYKIARRAYERIQKDRELLPKLDSLLAAYVAKDSTQTLEIKSLRVAVEELQKADSLSQVQVVEKDKVVQSQKQEIRNLKGSKWIERAVAVALIILAIAL